MSLARRLELEHRRGELVARSRMLRGQFAEQALPLQRPFSLVDRVGDGVRWLLARPYWIIPLVALPLIFRPVRAYALGWRVFAGWRIWQRTRRLIRSLS